MYRPLTPPDYPKAVRIVEKQIQEMNRKQRGKEPEASLDAKA